MTAEHLTWGIIGTGGIAGRFADDDGSAFLAENGL